MKLDSQITRVVKVTTMLGMNFLCACGHAPAALSSWNDMSKSVADTRSPSPDTDGLSSIALQ